MAQRGASRGAGLVCFTELSYLWSRTTGALDDDAPQHLWATHWTLVHGRRAGHVVFTVLSYGWACCDVAVDDGEAQGALCTTGRLSMAECGDSHVWWVELAVCVL